MAKHCTVCNQDYADDLAACPHCASAKKTHLAGRGEDRTTQLVGRSDERSTQLGDLGAAEAKAAASPSDSGIDFGLPPTSKPATGDAGGAEPLSGVSSVAWSLILEESRAQEGKEIQIDSPSDAEMLVHGTAEPPPATPAGSGEELVGELVEENSVAEEEAETGAETEEVELSEAPPQAAEHPLDSTVDLGGLSAELVELSEAPPQPMPPPSDSAVDLGGPPAELVEDDSGAIVRATPTDESAVFMAELASDASRVDLVQDSDLNFLGGEVVEAAPVEEAALPAADADAPLDDPAAEVVDAVVDEESAFAELTEAAALDAVVEDHDSSAVDLGASPIVSEASLSAEEIGEIVEVAEASSVDLEGLQVPATSTAEQHPSSESSVDLGSHAEIATSSLSAEGIEAVGASGLDLAELNEPAAGEAASDLALESLLSDSPSSEAVAAEEAVDAEEPVAAEEEAGVAAEEPIAAEAGGLGLFEETLSEESAAAAEESAVSEDEVNDLLAGLEETPAESEAGVSPEEAAEIAEGEEAIAAAEEEEAAEAAAEEGAVEDEEEAKPAKPVKQRSRIPALVGGTFLGMLIGVGGLIGARVGGFDVPAMIGLGKEAKTSKGTSQPGGTAAAPATFESLKAMVMNGDWEGASKAGLDSSSPAKPEELANRGDYRLGQYLQKAGNKINPQDPALQPALTDLQQAAAKDDPTAIYDLAWIKELAGQLPEARAEYAKGVQKFQNKAEWKEQFEAAVDRVDWKVSLKQGGAAWMPLPQRPEERAALLALLLIGLQQPPLPAPQPPQPGQQPPAAPKEETKEAGFDFWQAAKLARDGKYGDAVRAIERARKLHDERRFKRLRKAQNPLSDPAEDIFLRCCDELKAYWQMQNHLRDGGYLTEKNTPAEALQAVLQKAETNTAVVKDLTDKLVAAKVIGKDDDVSKGLDQLLSDKKNADDMVADLKTKLQTAMDDNTKLAADLKGVKKTLEERDADLATAKEANKKLETANGELSATLKMISDALANARLLDPRDKPNLGAAVKKVVEVARINDPQGLIRQQHDDIAQLTASLKQRWRPEQMLPLWLLLLDENRGRPELMDQARRDVERVKMDPGATPVQKGEAGIVLGLALRNAEKFDEAKAVLEAAQGTVDQGEWAYRAAVALKEVSNPAAYFSRQAQELYDRGRMTAALGVLDRAMKALPDKEQGKLLAQRSLIELDAARSKAKKALTANDPLIVAARKDAAEAVKAGQAEGHYALGRIAEELGRVDAAIKSYRAAVAAHGNKLDAEGARYSMALGRALLLPRQARPAQPVMVPPGGEKVGWNDPAPYPAQHYEDMKHLVLMLTLGLQGPLLPGEEPGLAEAEKLADDVLNAERARPGTIPFTDVAQAWAIKGRWNVALQTYVEGIRPLLPRDYANGLMYLTLNHPRLKRPDSLRIPNPFEAEKHFAAGLNFYFDQEYANAEREFLQTVLNDANDARYFYFLGLSRLAQNRRSDAYDDFAQGAELEQVNRPAPAAVSQSLERIQGPTRRTINEFRKRP